MTVCSPSAKSSRPLSLRLGWWPGQRDRSTLPIPPPVNNRRVIPPLPPDETLTDRATGLWLGLELGLAMAARSPEALTVEAFLVAGVADTILKTETMEPQELVARWLRQPLPPGGLRPSQTALVLALLDAGHEPGPAVEIATRSTSRPGLDPPLLRSLPIAVATVGRGLLLRVWSRRAVMTTHPDPPSVLLGFAVPRFAQDLLIHADLGLSLARTTQALREDAPESVIRALQPLEIGQAVPGGQDATAVVQAAVHALSTAGSWDEAVSQAASRALPGDQALILTAALAGALFGAGPLRGRLEPERESRAESQAVGLLGHARKHQRDPLPPLVRAAGG